MDNYIEREKVNETALASRESCSTILNRKSKQLRDEAIRLENLAKVMDFLPNELENALYSLVESYVYNKNR